MKIRTTRPAPPPRNWTSTISAPSRAATRSAISRILTTTAARSAMRLYCRAIKKWAYAHFSCQSSTTSIHPQRSTKLEETLGSAQVLPKVNCQALLFSCCEVIDNKKLAERWVRSEIFTFTHELQLSAIDRRIETKAPHTGSKTEI